MTPAEEANLTRFDGKRAGFYEVYFVEAQDAENRTGLWVRYTLSSPASGAGDAVAELWAMYFDRRTPANRRAHKRTIPFAEAEIDRARFRFAIGDAQIDQSGCRGALGEGADRIAWDLRWAEDRLLVHFPFEAMYSGPLPTSKVMSPHYDLRASGSYSLGDTRHELDKAPGQQSHIWGTRHAHRWIWAHCNTFNGHPGVVLEALTAQIHAGPIALPPLTFLALRYEGNDHVFNRPLELLRANESRVEGKETSGDAFTVSRWIVGGGDEALRVRAELWADIDTFIGVRYKDPNGKGLVCHHSKVACARLEILRPDDRGWRVAETLYSEGAALEFVGRRPDPRVPILI